ncbi:MAG: DUF2798 domain-containing protein [Pseudomonadota bacterium]
MIPARFAPLLFAFILSGMMSAMVSALSTWRALGMEGMTTWPGAWIASWAVACPAAFFAGPVTRKIVARLVAAD